MDSSEAARLLLRNASRRMSGAEIELCEQVADGHEPATLEFSSFEGGHQAFTRICTEFANYLTEE